VIQRSDGHSVVDAFLWPNSIPIPLMLFYRFALHVFDLRRNVLDFSDRAGV
jgi:hypothetical protein